jgi:hypothetical protein
MPWVLFHEDLENDKFLKRNNTSLASNLVCKHNFVHFYLDCYVIFEKTRIILDRGE